MMLVGLSACSKDEAASANSQLDATQAELDAANTQNSELQSSLDDSQASASSLAVDGAATQAKNDELTASLAAETKRADDAEAQIAAAVGKFPVTVTASTDEFNVIGSYNMTFTEAFCQGVPQCGTERPVVNARIIQGSNGLEIDVPAAQWGERPEIRNLFRHGHILIAGDGDGLPAGSRTLYPLEELESGEVEREHQHQ